MKTNPVCIAILLLAACCCAPTQTSAGTGVPCGSPNPPDGWHTYVDRIHGFCFRYPSSYKRIPSAKQQIIKFKSLHSDAYIFVWFENKPFDLQRFVKSAPTGYDSPPSPVQVGEYTFYYYGPGGGGVSYPDAYFFNLLGKTLYITFDGPYINDKTPSAETKKLERELLATFRLFRD
jgi:hypothetical protein